MNKAEIMTIPIHGTFSRGDPWTLPSESGSLHNFLRTDVFPDDYMVERDKDVFCWTAGDSNADRDAGVKKLKDYCETWKRKIGFERVRLVGHSHGATVANGAVRELLSIGVGVETLINLAVPVRFKDTDKLLVPCNPLRPCYPNKHKPDLPHVAGKRMFVFHARVDLVVTLYTFGRQNFGTTQIKGQEIRRVTKRQFPGALPHWYPTLSDCWRKEGWDRIRF